LPLVPRKKKSSWNRSPRKSWKPASTSNFPERACRHSPGGPAPTLGLLRSGAVRRPKFPDIAKVSSGHLWAAPALSPIPVTGCDDRRQTRC
jgi:hypothetical protein